MAFWVLAGPSGLQAQEGNQHWVSGNASVKRLRDNKAKYCMKASIVIPVYNRPDDLAHVLTQLTAQNDRDFEVVVVDDGSTPPVAESARPENFNYPLRVERHEQRRGVGPARNTGVKCARAEVVLFVDSDGDLSDPDWFRKHMDLRARAGEMAAGLGAEHFVFHSEVRGLSTTVMGRVDTYSNWFGSCMTKASVVRDRHVPTHNTSVHRNVFEVTGYFDEALGLCEDVEWCLRCHDHGVALIYIPGAPVGHFDRDTLRGVWDHYLQLGRYAPLVRRKRPASSFSALYPRNRLAAALLFLPFTTLLTTYITVQWLRRSPMVLAYVPGLFFANVAYYLGMCQTLNAEE